MVLVSSVAVHGSRNPYRNTLISSDTPRNPRDIYGATKAAAEEIVAAASIDWVILRLGGVVFPAMDSAIDSDTQYLGGLLPEDGRIETVDVRDVAIAVVEAVSAPCVGKVLPIGGGAGNQLVQGDLARGFAAAIGLNGALPRGRSGDPDDDDAWHVTDWMDTIEAQSILRFQTHSFDDTMRDLRTSVGWKRYLLRLASPVIRVALWWRSPLRRNRSVHAPMWSEVESRWDPSALAPLSAKESAE